jgi:hypothetical protein
MPETGEDTVRAIADEIERYIAEHPEAADTAEGIERWWLPPRLSERAALVAESLDGLVALGVIASLTLPDGRVLYMSPRSSARRPRDA